MKYCLIVMSCVFVIGSGIASAQDDPEEMDPADEFNPFGTVVVRVTSIQCLKTGDRITASASFSAATTETPAAVMYTRRIREYAAYTSGSMLTGLGIWHSNGGSSIVPADVTQTWSSAISNEYVDENGSFVGEANIEGTPEGGGTPDSDSDAAYDNGDPA